MLIFCFCFCLNVGGKSAIISDMISVALSFIRRIFSVVIDLIEAGDLQYLFTFKINRKEINCSVMSSPFV